MSAGASQPSPVADSRSDRSESESVTLPPGSSILLPCSSLRCPWYLLRSCAPGALPPSGAMTFLHAVSPSWATDAGFVTAQHLDDWWLVSLIGPALGE